MTLLEYNNSINLKRSDKCEQPKTTAIYQKNIIRPGQKRCPHCQWKLKRWYTLWSKYLSTLGGRFHVFSQGYRCPNLDCLEPQAVYHSTEAETLSVPECSYGIDVIVEVGYYPQDYRFVSGSGSGGQLRRFIPYSRNAS